MALEYTCGRFQWLSTDAVSSTKVISGLSFQPKALKFWSNGTDGADFSANSAYAGSMGFAAAGVSKGCVAYQNANNLTAAACSRMVTTSYVIAKLTSAGIDGALSVTALNADGFTVMVIDQSTAHSTVFWEAWGGSDITAATVGIGAAPTTPGTTTHLATGFETTPAKDDQVVMLLMGFGGSNNTITAENPGFSIGFATGSGVASNLKMVMAGVSIDHGSATTDTDGWGTSSGCAGKIDDAGAATLLHKANLDSFATDSFTLRWNAAATVAARFVWMAIKGGGWQAGEYLHNGSSSSNTVTITGLPFVPKGLELITIGATKSADGAAGANATISYGWANSTSNRACFSIHDRDNVPETFCRLTTNTDSILSYSRSPNVLQRFDLDSIGSGNTFSTIVDAVGQGVASQWIGYLTFGDRPGTTPAIVGYSFGSIY